MPEKSVICRFFPSKPDSAVQHTRPAIQKLQVPRPRNASLLISRHRWRVPYSLPRKLFISELWNKRTRRSNSYLRNPLHFRLSQQTRLKTFPEPARSYENAQCSCAGKLQHSRRAWVSFEPALCSSCE